VIDIASRFAENLVRHRDLAGISQEELGYRASLHRTEISQLERGLRIPRIDTMIKLAHSLGLGYEQLLAGIDWTPGEVRPGQFAEVSEWPTGASPADLPASQAPAPAAVNPLRGSGAERP